MNLRPIHQLGGIGLSEYAIERSTRHLCHSSDGGRKAIEWKP